MKKYPLSFVHLLRFLHIHVSNLCVTPLPLLIPVVKLYPAYLQHVTH